jgi:crotonobetainyl-CoA:carnitine CoA-transferase CaiB-like acyl-CoA transferase
MEPSGPRGSCRREWEDREKRLTSPRPLAGITVLEIGHSIAAPFAGMILGELGADVVKLENPKTGDYARDWGPPFWAGAASTFQAVNRGKRGITVDFTSEEEVARLRSFIRDQVDVLIHNLKFGALDKYGLSAAALTAEKPELVYCNLGAFGSTGPLKDRPGYDPLMQAHAGLMSLMGEDERPPVRVGVSIIDISTGMWSVIGILAALQERGRTRKGGVVDTSLYESALNWMNIPIANYLASGKLPKRQGSGTTQIVPYQAFRTSDGWIMVLAGNDNLFRRMCEALGRPALAEDERFRTNGGRVVNRGALIPLLQDVIAGAPTAVWRERLDAVGVPNGPIQTADQVVADPQTEALGILQRSPDGELTLVGMPLSFDGERPGFERRAPKLAEHQEEVLGKAKR